MHHPPPPRRRLLRTALTLALIAVGVATVPVLATAPAHAAEQGTGFGTWAPLSWTGWHGSMRVGDVHTYCIHPGLPVATGTTTDNGETSDVNGLTPQQLVSINHLVTTYGQTDDPVQAGGRGRMPVEIALVTVSSPGPHGSQLEQDLDTRALCAHRALRWDANGFDGHRPA